MLVTPGGKIIWRAGGVIDVAAAKTAIVDALSRYIDHMAVPIMSVAEQESV